MRANLGDVPATATIIVDVDEFTERNLAGVGYTSDPLTDGTLVAHQVHEVAMTSLTRGAVAETGLGEKGAELPNMFALGLLSFMYGRGAEITEMFLRAEVRPLVLGWGSTYGPIGAACRRIRRAGGSVTQAHLRHLNPLPANLGAAIARCRGVVLPEMNLGQLASVLRSRYLADIRSVTKVAGMPFTAEELQSAITTSIEETVPA